ncbi:hypothetical protein [Archaeoglobus veneficus]|uniref:Uncharacterized protein n=1 Tax=Archaeoglobus veneficus (strain DSM 11195 / SNP6) TaxID=693661 RepID=F2KTB1_ARCVS|nr:hypothetical protein [Archaeoglobus veneficus]AEA47141.1 hypothetical protein Arcve_1133 [Archaeoglobus veneficus SNP6]
MALSYRNTYLEKVGELMKYCMELAKTVDEAMDDIKRVSKDLRDPERVAEIFRMDSEYIVHVFMAGGMTEEEAEDCLKKLKVYALSQLQEHYNLVIQLLKDTEKKVSEAIEKTIEEIQFELPESTKDEIKYSIERAREDIEIIAKEMQGSGV